MIEPQRREVAPPPGVDRLDDRTLAPLLPRRDARGHKGSFGTLVAVAGSLDYLGAALLVSLAAARAGTGLVCLAIPASLQPLVAGRVMETITLGLPERSADEVDPSGAVDAIAGRAHDALLVGSGMRAGPSTVELVMALIAGGAAGRSSGAADDAPGTALPPGVLDAEALNSLAATPGWHDVARRPLVLTPHPGEFARLERGLHGATAEPLPDDDVVRAERARALAAATGQIVVLKGAHTVVAAPDGRASQSGWENPALATAGTGDVLAGTIGAFLAQGVDPYDAARLGVHLHGAAGDAVSQRVGEAGLLASDLPSEIAYARRRLAGMAQRATTGARIGFGSRSAADA